MRAKPVRTVAKTQITKAERLISAGELEEAQQATAAAVKALVT